MRTGDIYQVNLDPTVGDEMRKTRPVVVLNPGHQKNLRLALVAPVTKWHQRWEGNSFFLIIDPLPHHGLRKKSAVDCFQIRALSHNRFIKKLGMLTEEELDHIKSSLSLILDIEPEHCTI